MKNDEKVAKDFGYLALLSNEFKDLSEAL